MTPEELQEILKKHKMWLDGEEGGERANLRYANLQGADIQDANLRYANLQGADLQDANLQDADLRDVYLRDANLRAANLRDANLRAANLQDADLRYADLRYADLRYANLRYANITNAKLRDANLRYANITNAKLRDANLQAANLQAADLPPSLSYSPAPPTKPAPDPYAEAAIGVSTTVKSKQAAYGDSFGKAGEVLKALYPEGIPTEKFGDALTVVRVVDKLFRIATDKDALGESPWKDIAGYALLSIVKETK